ncbi:hypothetical protein BURCENBC7_AP1583 [Burkholderia cenocepacia BC7]|nr:hypothetical protein BURCENK562V_C4804 [Burkholderia cenocepacia K56-2Valvano]ERI30892.1 hypothetical protein BURCENBC7_AP1583 [Burkholderia cenocepacia BC7]
MRAFVLTLFKNAYHGEKFRVGSRVVRRARVHARAGRDAYRMGRAGGARR